MKKQHYYLAFSVFFAAAMVAFFLIGVLRLMGMYPAAGLAIGCEIAAIVMLYKYIEADLMDWIDREIPKMVSSALDSVDWGSAFEKAFQNYDLDGAVDKALTEIREDNSDPDKPATRAWVEKAIDRKTSNVLHVDGQNHKSIQAQLNDLFLNDAISQGVEEQYTVNVWEWEGRKYGHIFDRRRPGVHIPSEKARCYPVVSETEKRIVGLLPVPPNEAEAFGKAVQDWAYYWDGIYGDGGSYSIVNYHKVDNILVKAHLAE